jgi:hypothetical protein
MWRPSSRYPRGTVSLRERAVEGPEWERLRVARPFQDQVVRKIGFPGLECGKARQHQGRFLDSDAFRIHERAQNARDGVSVEFVRRAKDPDDFDEDNLREPDAPASTA